MKKRVGDLRGVFWRAKDAYVESLKTRTVPRLKKALLLGSKRRRN